MSVADFFFVLCVVCITPWLLAGWFRIPRYIWYFQQAHYDFQQYELSLSRTKTENRYFIVFLIVLGIFPFVVCGAFFSLPIAVFNSGLPVGIVYLALFLLAVSFAPRDRLSKGQFARSPRAIRLMITAFFIELCPVLIGSWIISGAYNMLADPKNSPESMGALAVPILGFMIVLSLCVGPTAFMLTRFALPIANVLNKPIDRVLGPDAAK